MRALPLLLCLCCAACSAPAPTEPAAPPAARAPAIAVRRVVPPAVTNLVATFYSTESGAVVIHTGPPAAPDSAASALGEFTPRSTWELMTSTDLVHWAAMGSTNAPGDSRGVVVVPNTWEPCRFYIVRWR